VEDRTVKETWKTGSIALLCAFSIGCASEPLDDETNSQMETGPVDNTIQIEPGNMIDDLDDGDDAIIAASGRSGDWYCFNDGSAGGVQTPSPDDDFAPESGGANDSSHAVHSSGSGFSTWGSGIGFDLNGADPGGTSNAKGTFDASSFTGIAFYAKGAASVDVTLATLAVIDEADGGTCTPGMGDAESCSNAHRLTVTVTDEWQQYAIAFENLAQDEGWGQTIAFDPSDLASILFQTEAGADYEFWIDQIGFY
jgi:hypothetical protein